MDETPESSTSRSPPGSQSDSAATWFLLAATVLGLVVTALLFPIPFHGRAATAIGDLVHAPLFGSLALGWLWGWQRLRPLEPHAATPSTSPATGPLPRGLLLRGLIVWIVLSGFGAMMELAQDGMGRSMSLHDAIANALGVAAAVSGYTGYRLLRIRRWISAIVFCGLAVAILVTAWVRPVRTLIDVSRVRRDFPLLASFETPLDASRWFVREAEISRGRRGATEGEYSLRAVYQPGDFPAISLTDLLHDWSAFTALELDATLDESHHAATTELFVNVVEGEHVYSISDEASVRFVLHRGRRQRLRIPLADLKPRPSSPPLNPSKIVRVDLALRDVSSSTVVWFDRLILVR